MLQVHVLFCLFVFSFQCTEHVIAWKVSEMTCRVRHKTLINSPPVSEVQLVFIDLHYAKLLVCKML